MNVIKLMGGIGNQLFQYAFGRVQSLNGIQVYYDDSWFTHPTRKRRLDVRWPRPYRLDKFQLNIPYSPQLEGQEVVNEERTGFDMKLLKKDNCYFIGYWQYLPYYKDYLPILRKDFWLSRSVLTKEYYTFASQIIKEQSISVHVRRGDYTIQKGFHDLPFSYYLRGLRALNKKGVLFVFSDDISWCRAKFQEDFFESEIIFVDLEDYLCFELMKLCKYHITSNSTYSYWVALLSGNPTVCPMHWLWEKDMDTKEMRFPKEWIKVEDYAV